MEEIKNKIDWFYFAFGIALLIMSFIYFIRENDWFLIFIQIILGIMFLFKAYYPEKLFKKI